MYERGALTAGPLRTHILARRRVMRFLGGRVIDTNRSPMQHEPVELLYGSRCIFSGPHSDKAESAGTIGLIVPLVSSAWQFQSQHLPFDRTQ
jgi:hypothetical protein